MNELAKMIFGSIGEVLDRIIPDKNKRAEAKEALEAALLSNEYNLAIEQIKVNAIEAQSENIFKSGWRPFIGWTCGTAFSLHFVIFPILNWFIVLFGHSAINIAFDMQSLMYALGGLLGLGGMRTYEKMKGVS